MEAESFWKDVKQAVPDVIFGTNQLFKNDPAPDKVSLVIGAYRDENGKPYVFPVVKKIEEQMLLENLNKEYLQMEGDPDFVTASRNLLFGECNQERIATVQSLSGTGALRVASGFIKEMMGLERDLYISDPTWGNHNRVFVHSGFQAGNLKKYPYYDPKTRMLNFEGMMGALSNAAPGSIVVLHACAHNPTGVDPTKEQWAAILKLLQDRKLLPFFDCAYQGYASGDLDYDAYAIRLFYEAGMEFFCCQSFAKNCGMYGERIGALHLAARDKDTALKVHSQLKLIVRGMYSNPPIHGARLMARVMGVKENKEQWKGELKDVAGRILEMRKLLKVEMEELKTPGTWDHIVQQIGMFSYTGLTPEQCQHVMDKHHIYLLKTGRISISGINKGNVKRIAAAFDDAVKNVK